MRASVALLAFLIGTSAFTCRGPAASAQTVVSVRVTVAPPPLPIYVQPVIPADGYLWVPGYWDWDPDFGYFWVPGTWVLPPRPNLLWTPGYWGWDDGVYVFHRGYWDTDVGYYGGVDYGYGYGGSGYQGGYWQGPRFYYNTTVNNVTTVNITNIYTKTVVAPTVVSRISYNGGAGGLTARPTPRDLVIARLPHVQPTQAQVEQRVQARTLPVLRVATNHGVPPIAATPRAAAFHSPAVTPAKPLAAVAPQQPAQPTGTATHPPVANGVPPFLPQPKVPDHAQEAVHGAPAQQLLVNHQAEPERPRQDTRLPIMPPQAGAQPNAQKAPVQGPSAQQPEKQRQQEQQRATELEAQKQAQQRAAAQHEQDVQHAQQMEAQRRAQQQAEAQRQQAAEAQRQAAQRQQEIQRAQQLEAQRRAQEAAQEREAAAQRAQQAAEAQQRATQQHEQAAQRAQQAAAMQQRAEEQRRAAEAHQHRPACGQPDEPPCR